MDAELCKCGKPSTVGATGVKDHVVYHEDYCDDCYNKQKYGEEPTKPVRHPEQDEFKGLGVKVSRLNEGRQLVIKKGNKTVDFWPGTGTYVVRGFNTRGRGREQLIEELGRR